MPTTETQQKTLVGAVDSQVLAFTTGKDPVLDLALTDVDCIGTAAHVTMLSGLTVGDRPILTAAERAAVIRELIAIMQAARRGAFTITAADQDIHLAVERRLTERLGDVGRRVHTARSRNDQVATDLRLYAKQAMLAVIDEGVAVVDVLLRLARRHAATPMVGRTHMQPAMPSSVGVWAAAHAESLIDDMALVMGAYDYNDRCPLGSAAGYGVPLPIDRRLTSDLLGFAAPLQGVLYAGNARGKAECVVLSALLQVMLTLSRLAEDLILFSTPEMPYFALPPDCTTGSSIMPQKRNPDVPELVRAKASRVLAHVVAAASIVRALPSGYNRDLQEIKEPFLDGLATTRDCLAVTARVVKGLQVDRRACRAAFGPAVHATDHALALVAAGVPFREAYDRVKADMAALDAIDPRAALAARRQLGGAAELALELYAPRDRALKAFTRDERRGYHRTVARLLGVPYPDLEMG